MHQEGETKHTTDDATPAGAVPAYLLDREGVSRAKVLHSFYFVPCCFALLFLLLLIPIPFPKVLSNTIKQKRKEKAGKWNVPIPTVKPISDDEMFKVISSGKRQRKHWKRMVTKVTFVGENFTRKPPKYERFIRPTGLRFKKAHVTHPELKATFCLDILGVKKNPSSPMYTGLGVITKGTIIEVRFVFFYFIF